MGNQTDTNPQQPEQSLPPPPAYQSGTNIYPGIQPPQPQQQTHQTQQQPQQQPQPHYIPQPSCYIQTPPGGGNVVIMSTDPSLTTTTAINHPLPPVVIVQQQDPTVPKHLLCPRCHQQVVSRPESSPSTLAYVSCALMAVFGFWLCCFIPFCVDSCQTVEHECPNCGQTLAVYNS